MQIFEGGTTVSRKSDIAANHEEFAGSSMKEGLYVNLASLNRPWRGVWREGEILPHTCMQISVKLDKLERNDPNFNLATSSEEGGGQKLCKCNTGVYGTSSFFWHKRNLAYLF